MGKKIIFRPDGSYFTDITKCDFNTIKKGEKFTMYFTFTERGIETKPTWYYKGEIDKGWVLTSEKNIPEEFKLTVMLLA